jgi:hypothetical protein
MTYKGIAQWALSELKSPVNLCMKHQQIHQLFIQFINYVWYLLHILALHCHPRGAFLVPSERCSIEELIWVDLEYDGSFVWMADGPVGQYLWAATWPRAIQHVCVPWNENPCQRKIISGHYNVRKKLTAKLNAVFWMLLVSVLQLWAICRKCVDCKRHYLDEDKTCLYTLYEYLFL